MSPPHGAAQAAQNEPPHAYVDHSAPYADAAAAGDASDARADAGGSAAAATQSGIEKDVGSILAGLNQEQLESIVAAARATDGEQAYHGNGQYDTASALAHLPPSLGQAASTLTSFASSFKRSHAPEIPTEEEINAGTALSNTAAHLNDAPPPPGMEHDLSQQRASAQKAAQTSAAHDSAATAAALAAMGTLAGRQLQQHGHGHALGEGREGLGADAGMDAKFVSDHGLAGARFKRKGPELDRQRKDNHKEVERRRRSAINDGIVQLSQIVPGCDVKNTNKGSIIIAAVRYIQDQKNNEASNIEKWTLEKLLMDQAMNDLSMSLDESRREVERLRAQLGMAEASGDKHGAAAPAAAAAAAATHYPDQRFAQPAYHGEAVDAGHGEQDLAVSLDQSHVAHSGGALDHNMLGGHALDEANKRARLV